MSNSNSNTSGGIGLCGLVFVVFLVLKLAEIGQVATWSWWWVTAPLWGPIALVLGIAAAAFAAWLMFMLVVTVFCTRSTKNGSRE
jgi:hypothetical protein